MTQADLNGDGKQDLIYLEGGQSAVHTLINAGNGQFTDAQTIPLPAGFGGDITIADVNGDGKLDVIVGAWSADIQVAVLLGHGDGTFGDPMVSDLGAATPNWAVIRSGFAVGDFNHDGKLDLVAPDSQDYELYVLVGDGTGKFNLSNKIFNGSGPSNSAVADLNHDGNLDLVVHGGLGVDVTVYLGNPDGTFQTGVRYTGSHYITSFLLCDVDGDGSPDLVVTNQVNGLEIFRGHLDGTFDTTSTGGLSNYGPWAFLLAAGDFNGDGIVDLYVTSSDGIGLMIGKADLTFAAPVPFATSSTNCAVGDINNDGYLDILAASSTGLSILYGRADGTLQTADTLSVGYYAVAALGDFNGDHRPDIALAGDPNSTPLLINDGLGKFHLNQGPNASASTGSIQVVSGDFNGDGRSDLVIQGTGFANVQFALSSDSLSAPVPLPLGSNYVASPYGALAVGDFNQDGRDDLVIPPDILFGQANNTFTIQSVETNIAHVSRRFTDLNKDGHSDLVFGGLRDIEVSLGDGTGRLTNTGRSYDTSIPNQDYIDMPTSIDVADIDGDGNPDVATTISSGPYVEIFYGNGDGTLQDAQILTVDRNYSHLFLVDVDQDGKPDLVLGDGSTISILHHTGARTFGGQVSYSIGSGDLIDVADMNGDGLPDLVVRNGPTSVAIAYNEPGPGTVTAAMMVDPEPSEQTKPITLTLAFTVAQGKQNPTGTVWFSLDNSQIAAVPVAGNTVSYIYTNTSSLTLGSHLFSAVYSGDTNYLPGSFSAKHNVVPLQVATTTTLAANTGTATASQTVVFTATVAAVGGGKIPFGTVAFHDGSTTIGTRTLDPKGVAVFDTAILTSGLHTITANFQANPYFGASQSNNIEVQVGTVVSSVAISADPNPAPAGSAVLLTATVSSGTGVPTGAVTFYDGSAALETRTIAANGTATLGATFSSGTHSITASYAANDVWNSSSSTVVVVSNSTSSSSTVLSTNPDFALRLGKPSSVVMRGTPFTMNIQLVAIRGFEQDVRLTCAVTDPGAECTFQPALLQHGHGESQIRVMLSNKKTYLATSSNHSSGPNAKFAMFSVFALCLGMLRLRTHKARKILIVVLAFILTGSCISCGHGVADHHGSVRITVTGSSGTGSSAVIHSEVINIRAGN